FVAIIFLGGSLFLFPDFAHLHGAQDLLSALTTWNGMLIILSAIIGSRLIVAPYGLHKQDQQRIYDLEQHLRPGMDLSFHPEEEGVDDVPLSIRMPDGSINHALHRAKYFRIRAEALSGPKLVGCRAFLTGIRRARSASGDLETIRMPHPLPLRDGNDFE